MKNWYDALKSGVGQIEIIRRAINKEAADGKAVARRLKKTKDWFNDTVFSEFGGDAMEAGYVESMRTELSEDMPGRIFGQAAIRKMRSKLKSFMSAHKVMKNCSGSTLFSWTTRKRGYAAAKGDSRQKFDKRPKFNNGYKKH